MWEVRFYKRRSDLEFFEVAVFTYPNKPLALYAETGRYGDTTFFLGVDLEEALKIGAQAHKAKSSKEAAALGNQFQKVCKECFVYDGPEHYCRNLVADNAPLNGLQRYLVQEKPRSKQFRPEQIKSSGLFNI